MYCNNCGAQNSDQAKWCSNCGSALGQRSGETQPTNDVVVPPAGTSPIPTAQTQFPPPPPPGPRVESYLIHSLLVTLCCCLPLGIVAIVYAASVSNKLAVGDIPGAMEASNKAKMWCIIAAVGGLVFGVGWVGLSFLGGLANLH